MNSAWVGVDFDGTLARYDGWKGPEHIGEPIPTMVEYVKDLLDRGVTVKIVTARAATSRILEDEELYEKVITGIRQWCKKHIGQYLEVTAEKDFGMLFLLDDRAIQITPNTGLPESFPYLPTPHEVKQQFEYHYSPNNPGSPTYGK